uniref:Uncharacterized protein n=1 Tax=Anguilla anguilla TaxID=7936 RepID=A0A0E9TH93_ANGAN
MGTMCPQGQKRPNPYQDPL